MGDLEQNQSPPHLRKHIPLTDQPEDIGEAVSSLNRKFEEQEAQRRAQRLGLGYFDLRAFPIDPEALELLTKEEALVAEAVPFFKDRRVVKIATADPQNENLRQLLRALEEKKYKPELYLVSPSSFEEAVRHYMHIKVSYPGVTHEVKIRSGPDAVAKLTNLSALSEELTSLPVTEILNLVLSAAVTMRASDIHLEPEKKQLKLRFRVDGVLTEIVSLPLALMRTLLSRIKLLAGLKLNVVAKAQDGRFTAKLSDRNIDIRVSVLPSAYGETVVMRLLGVQEIGLDMAKLGLRGRALEIIQEQLSKPNGMILTTGPTGSGKTTTLYAFLNHLNRPGVKIITLEEPVEYELEGVVQTPVGREAGVDFAQGLRAILRQDPDIVMVGEIRDFETAQTACQAALTGHIVLSTLHTNDAAGAIPRLLDLGVKPVTLAPALSALIAQRLLRRLCHNCRELHRPSAKELAQVKLALSRIPSKAKVKVPAQLTFYRSQGCKECHHLGYRGRLGVFEVFSVDEHIQTLVFQQSSTVDLKKAAVEQGMLTMQQDAVLKALDGLTDLSEVWRVTEE